MFASDRIALFSLDWPLCAPGKPRNIFEFNTAYEAAFEADALAESNDADEKFWTRVFNLYTYHLLLLLHIDPNRSPEKLTSEYVSKITWVHAEHRAIGLGQRHLKDKKTGDVPENRRTEFVFFDSANQPTSSTTDTSGPDGEPPAWYNHVMRIYVPLLCLVLCLSGCTSTKEAVGNYVIEATTDQILNKLDKTLINHNTSLAAITSILDTNQDHKLSAEEIKQEVTQTVKDATVLEAHNYIQTQIGINDQQILALSAKNQSTTKYEIYNAILGLVAAYLGKQIYSARQDGHRDKKIAVLEKLLNRDIDNDGKVG